MPSCFSAFFSLQAFTEEFQQLSGDKGPNNLILLIILAAIWGSSFFVIKICLSSFTPTSIASLRLIIASIFLIILYYSYNNHPKLNLDLILILSFISTGTSSGLSMRFD